MLNTCSRTLRPRAATDVLQPGFYDVAVQHVNRGCTRAFIQNRYPLTLFSITDQSRYEMSPQKSLCRKGSAARPLQPGGRQGKAVVADRSLHSLISLATDRHPT